MSNNASPNLFGGLVLFGIFFAVGVWIWTASYALVSIPLMFL